VTLEGPDSPIEAILASEEQKPAISAIVKATTANGTAPNGTAPNGATTEARGTLAERIRALQAHASRARQPG